MKTINKTKWQVISDTIKLRDYQLKCLNSIEKGLEKHKSVLIQVPTGGGKTLIFNAYAFNKTGNTLVLVHRKELLSQTADKYKMIGGAEENIGYIAQGILEINRLTVGMMQTVYKSVGKINFKYFNTVIIDEAHHSMASTWRAVIETAKESGCKVIGVTATPFRTDEQQLKDLYDELVFKLDISDLIKEGHLVSVIGKMVYIDADYSKLKTSSNKSTGESDYSAKSIEKVLNKEEINKQVVQKWVELGEDRKTIFFTVSIEHANALKSEFVKNNIKSECISSKLPTQERKDIIEKFKKGEVKVLVNVDILTEGFDDPSVQCVGLLRPTKSLSLYAQIVGRGIRLDNENGKKDCIILDFTGRNRKMSIVGLGELFDLPPELKEHIDKEGVSIGSVETDEIEEDMLGAEEIGGSEPKMKRELKVLIGKNTEDFSFEGKESMKYATKLADGSYVLTCGKNGKVLTLKKETKRTNSIYLNDKKIKSKLPDSYSWVVLNTLWKYYKDDFAEDFAVNSQDAPITLRQKDILARAKEKGLIDNIPSDMVSATNLISYLTNNKQQGGVIFNDPAGIQYHKEDWDSAFRYSYKGVRLNIAHALLLVLGLRISAPKWVTELKSGITKFSVSEFSKINTQNVKNKLDLKELEKLKSNRIMGFKVNNYVELTDAKLFDFIKYFKNLN